MAIRMTRRQETPLEDAIVTRTLSIPNETGQLKAVRGFVAEVIRHSMIPPEFENGILLAVDEAVSNIIAHAYREGRRDTIDISLEIDAHRFQAVIRDSGNSFDPKAFSMPDLHAHVADGRRHGLGIFLMRRVMDEVEYLFKEGVRNELRMTKYLDG